MKRRALVTGVNGQDALCLIPLLVYKGYEVHTTDRRRTQQKHRLPEYLLPHVTVHRMDMTDQPSIRKVIREVRPDEIYNLAAQSHVGWSFNVPEQTSMVNAIGVLYLLEAMREYVPEANFYQASTSEMFGGVQGDEAQNENTAFHPRSPYGVAKLAAYWYVRNYREAYGLKASSGILFNHESKYRGDQFLPKKVCNYAKKLRQNIMIGGGIEAALEEQGPLRIGNIYAKRDWGWAPEYVEGMWRICNQDRLRQDMEMPTIGGWTDMDIFPDAPPNCLPGSRFKDYVLGTGRTITVGEFVKAAFAYIGIDGQWVLMSPRWTMAIAEELPSGSVPEEERIHYKFMIPEKGIVLAEINPEYYRPAEVHVLKANARMAEQDLRWKASQESLQLIIEDMIVGREPWPLADLPE